MVQRLWQQDAASLGRPPRLLGWCVLVLVVIAVHQAFMGIGRCAQVMDGPHEHAGSGATATQQPNPALLTLAPDPLFPTAPETGFWDCPAQRAVLPVLAALAFLLALGGLAQAGQVAIGPSPWSRGCGFSLPPPLAPTRRRALLQVFFN
jgi:hypothetical protein